MDVSIIIVNFNTTNLLSNCIKTIYEKTAGLVYEVIVVDNNSSDRSYDEIKYLYSNVKIVENSENYGFGVANNIGISVASGKYVFLLNSDTLLLNNAVKIFFDFLESKKNENIAICGGSLFKSDLTHQVSYGNFPSFTQVIFNFGFDRIFYRYYQKKFSTACINLSSRPFQVDYISGANLFIRKSFLKTNQVFNDNFFMYFEETEFQYRLTSSTNSKIYMVPNAEIIHFGGGSFNKLKLNYFEASQIKFFELRYNKITSKFIKLILILQYSFKILLYQNRKYWRMKLIAILKA